MIYASIEQGGLLKSTDGGATWRDMDGVFDDVHRVVMSAARPDRLYVTGGDGIYVSEDGGESWSHWHPIDAEIGGYPDQLAFRPSNPDEMYVSAARGAPRTWRENNFAGSRISRSNDGGRTWTVLTNGLPDRLQSSVEAMTLEEWNDGFAIFAATTAGEVWYSGVNATEWSVIAEGLAPISKGGHYRVLTPA